MITKMPILIRRELWEHKALYVTPFVIAALVVFGFVLSFFVLIFTGSSVNAAVGALELSGAPGGLAGGAALVGAPFVVMNLSLAAVVFFYSKDALYEERQDRSIMFWRSLPVTDTETVLSKFLTAVFAAPLVTIAILMATQIVLLLLAALAISIGGGNPFTLLFGPLPLGQMWVLMVYLFLTSSLWFAPMIAWFLFCSAFAKRSVLIWVVVPWLVLIMLEGIVFRKVGIASMIGRRFKDSIPSAFDAPSVGMLESMDGDDVLKLLQGGDVHVLDVMAPGKFLATPGLWAGLIAAAVLLAAAVYFRRFRA